MTGPQIFHSIIIIGAGPAGISTAIEALRRGYSTENIVILEKSGEISHMVSTKYPEEKPVLANYKDIIAEDLGELHIKDMGKQEFQDYLRKVVVDKKLKIHFHQTVIEILKLKNGQFSVTTQEDTYLADAVFVAIGKMSAPRTLGAYIDPEASSRIHYDLQGLTKMIKNFGSWWRRFSG